MCICVDFLFICLMFLASGGEWEGVHVNIMVNADSAFTLNVVFGVCYLHV